MRGERIFAGLVVGLLLGCSATCHWYSCATLRRCPAAAAVSEPFVHVVRAQPTTAHLLDKLGGACRRVRLARTYDYSQSYRPAICIAIGARVPAGRGNGGMVLDLDGTVLQPRLITHSAAYREPHCAHAQWRPCCAMRSPDAPQQVPMPALQQGGSPPSTAEKAYQS